MPNHHLAPSVALPLLPNRSTVLAGLLVALLLAGCGGGGSSSSSSAASASGAGSNPATGTTPTPAAPITDTAAIRFLEQATFGPNSADITHLQAIGYDAWLTEQFATATSDYPNITDASSLDAVQAAFFRNAVTAPDQLRQRIAFALGQIFVVSHQKIDTRVGIAAFQRMLLADSFGTYRNVLKDVTVSPAMGNYLDMANNVKADPVAGTSPNENYGREVLQLFSVGVNQLNADGSVRVDAAKKPVPTYGQDTVEGFARAFSGWTYPTKAGAAPQDSNDENYQGAMELREAAHEPGSKLLLNGLVLPSGQGAAHDLDAAIDNISQHPNVGPFLGTRLIQALVKSNPSPAYVQRVASVFADNGQGTRGDLKAVVRAILLDPEARAGDVSGSASSDGKLREPVLFMTRLMRAFSGKTDGSALTSYAQQMRQDVFNAPSVFNFYPPSYKPQGTNVFGPEFKIANTPTLSARLNFVYDLTSQNLSGTTLDFSAITAAATDNAKLIALLDAQLLHGTAPDSLKQAVSSALPAAGSDNQQRAMLALYLFAASPAFNLQR